MSVHSDEKPFDCKLCPSKFKSKGELKQHLYVHTGEKPFTCNTCKKRFSGRSNLNRHMRIHTGEKKSQCKECSYATSSSLKRLTRNVHTEGKKRPNKFQLNDVFNSYVCDYCSNQTKTKIDLIEHMKMHTCKVVMSRKMHQ